MAAPEPVKVRIGFVPTHRWTFTPWCRKMLQDSLAAIGRIEGVELFAPRDSGDDKAIDASRGAVPHGSIMNIDHGQALAEYFAGLKLDGLIVCPLDFGDERAVAAAVQRLGLPVLLYATKEPPAGDDASLQRLSDSYCGNLAVATAMHRRKIPFRFAGVFFPDEAGLRREVEDFAAALSIAKGLRNIRVGQVGHRPPTFESVAYDEVAMAVKFGQMVIHRGFSDVDHAATAMPDDSPAVRTILADIRATAPTITVGEDYLLKAAKFEAALVEFCEHARLSGLAVQCWPQGAGIAMCAVLGRMTARGIPASCETDVLGTLSMLISQRSAMNHTVPHLIDWTIQHRGDPNRVLVWHCGNAPACLARNAREVALRHRLDMKGELPPRPADINSGLYQFQLKPGPVTFCRLAEYDGSWKMLIAGGRIVPSDETLAGTWGWVELADHARLYRTLVEEGFIHHASMIHGDQRRALALACRFLGIQPVEVA
ncbi:MAG: L-fucose/L-arabinose isomerase family protein [Phycisphaerae bacterium]